MPYGNVVRYAYMNRSKIMKNAYVTTWMKAYCTNALNHDQNSQSNFGTMKNGTNKGPSKPHTAVAIRPKATTPKETIFAMQTAMSSTQYKRFAKIAQASG